MVSVCWEAACFTQAQFIHDEQRSGIISLFYSLLTPSLHGASEQSQARDHLTCIDFQSWGEAEFCSGTVSGPSCTRCYCSCRFLLANSRIDQEGSLFSFLPTFADSSQQLYSERYISLSSILLMGLSSNLRAL